MPVGKAIRTRDDLQLACGIMPTVLVVHGRKPKRKVRAVVLVYVLSILKAALATVT